VSAVAAVARPLRDSRPNPRPDATPTRHLEIAPSRAQRRARPKAFYALATIAGIGVILLAQLLMSIVLADGAYRISGLQTEQRDLQRQQSALSEELQVWSSTQNLATNAKHLGMVASGNPVFLDISTGHVAGHASGAGSGGIGSRQNLVGNVLIDPTMTIDPDAKSGSADDDSDSATTPTPHVTPGKLPSPTTH
jgi:hypothetical protein